MKKMNRFSLTFLLLIFLVSSSSASTFGSFPEEAEKGSDDLSLTYRLNLVNLGEDSLKVDLRAEQSDEYNVSFSKQSFVIEPSTVVESPQGSGWYHLGNGRYTKTSTVSIEVDVSRYRGSNSLVFPIEVRSEPLSGREDGVSSRMVRVREHSFRAVLDPSLRPETREDNGDEVRFWDEERKVEEDFNFEDEEPKVREEEEENQSKMKTNRSKTEQKDSGKKDNEGSGVNTFTYIFAGGIAVSISYILLVT